jgi:pilus assembly protein CpaC
MEQGLGTNVRQVKNVTVEARHLPPAAASGNAEGLRCRWLAAALLAAGVALAGLVSAAVAAGDPPSRSVELASGRRTTSVLVPAGKSEMIHTDASFADIVVGDPEIADVMPLTDRSLSILGKKIGTTRVSVYGEGKKLVGVFDVEVSYDTQKLAAELARRFPTAQITVSTVNGRIMLSGSAPDAITLDKAITIAKQFGPEVINSVQVAQNQQVMLEVRFVEVTRNASRELGISWDVLGKDIAATAGLVSTLAGANPFLTSGLVSGSAPFGTVVGSVLRGGVSADVIIKALEERDMARRLAEPNLVALSGDTASFLAGGEFPFPVAAQFGTITVEWKRFGVGLAFTPTVLGQGLIHLKIEPEVSQLDPTNTIIVAGVQLPSLIVRRANTTIELRDGQSFAIAGLLQNIAVTNQAQLPWLGDVPVLGALFRSALYQKQETDLAIIVTPRIVRPARPGEPLRVPTDNTVPPNDPDVFLLGKQELTPGIRRQMAGGPPEIFGHVLDLPRGVPYARP